MFTTIKRPRPRLPQARQKTGYILTESKPKMAYLKQSMDKYLNLAQESLSIGDRVTAEGYYQHAEHYLRVMNELIKTQEITLALPHDLPLAEDRGRDEEYLSESESEECPSFALAG